MTNDGLYPLRGLGAHRPNPAASLAMASLPYAGTSGYSGTATSEERAHERDSSGKTATVQQRVLAYVLSKWTDGATIAEIRVAIPDEHHGTLSGALTALHKSGQITRLKDERRGKCSVYVHRAHINGRETVAPRRMKQRDQGLNDALNRVKAYLDGRSENSTLNTRDVIASSWRRDGDQYNHLRVEDLRLILKALR